MPDDLTAAEAGMWQAFQNGSRYDLSTGNPQIDDPHGVRHWGEERSVRARVVCMLLLNGPPALDGRVSAVKLTGLLISDYLDVAGGTVAPYVEFKDCRFEKEILLPESRFTTLRFLNCSIPRLEAARLQTEGDLHLPRCRVHRGIRFTDAQIGTDLLLSQAVVHGDRQDRTINGDGLSVGQDLQAELIESYGEFRMRGAKVGVSLSLRGSRLVNEPGKYALNAPQLTVERALYMTPAAVSDPVFTAGATPARGTRIQHFECRGGIRLDDGRVTDAIDLDRARLLMKEHHEFSLRRIQTAELRFLGERPESGKVVLSGAKVTNLRDQARSWPGPGHLEMKGFAYENLIPVDKFPLPARLDWVEAATPEYHPEPYERLAAVLRDTGEDSEAREVLLAKQRRRRETLPVAGKLWGYLQDWTVAYGYRPGRAALWMAVLWALGGYALSYYEPDAMKAGEGPAYQPVLFALDLILPVMNLGQDGYWRLEGTWQWLAATLTLLGWVLATTVAAGASRLLRRG
ncbi:oxidoreductase [Streptomyces sp. TRM66268-LWL]|uniref:Oxidoreductase n=1 Tax=Streptomyces polyasparticus TaxID=2767826 RepID=A0ABR7SAK0_9ACTN|nr:oxidoreductase [Streptomyces polyasparticus]MBC9712174.1 oxidoreductase [Streptomyces polyasparticus]